MSNLTNELAQRWNGLSADTRRLTALGTVSIAVLLFYTALWLPLQRDLARLHADVPRETEALTWMRAQAPTIKALRARMSTSAGPLRATLEQSATSHGVRTYITRLDADASNGARVTLEQVPFNMLVTWVSALQAAQGLGIDDATIDAQPASGLVNATLRLRINNP